MARNIVYEARRLAGLTQSEVANHIGVTQSTYSNKERANDFTAVERKKLIEFIGQDNIDQAGITMRQMNEPESKYDNKYNKLISEVNRLLELQKAGMIIQAEIIGRMQGLPPDEAIDALKKLYEEKTGQKVDI